MEDNDCGSVVSTRVPEEALSDVDSVDSMTTSKESKSTRSRPESERGPGRKKKKIRRAQLRYEALGLKWQDGEELKLRAAENALPGMMGSVAVSFYDTMMEGKKNEKVVAGDEKRKAIEDALVKEIPVEMARWVQIVDGELRCLICGKAATKGHLQSSEHVKRIEEDAIGTYMGGNALTTRRFNGDKCVGVPTKRMLYDFWGDALENLIPVAMEIHKGKGRFLESKENDYSS